MHAPWQVSSPLCLGNGASPRGPKFGISILRGNGPPFAACHHKIGGFVLARDPPAERGAPLFPLCSMTPLVLTVDFLSLPSLSWPRSPSSYSVSSLPLQAQEKPTDYNHIRKGPFGYSSPSNRHFFSFFFSPRE